MSPALLLAALVAVEAGEPAPDLGEMSRSLSGQVTLVMFFATWCKPCHRAFSELAGIQREVGGRAQIVLVESGDDAEDVPSFLAANPPPPGAGIAIDVSGEVRHRWGVHSFPSFFMIDRNGVVRRAHHGWGDRSAAIFARWLHELLGDPSPGKAARRQRLPSTQSPPRPPPEREVVKGVEVLR
jgi:thiol-disulfide isomerase/thioredoxin